MQLFCEVRELVRSRWETVLGLETVERLLKKNAYSWEIKGSTLELCALRLCTKSRHR